MKKLFFLLVVALAFASCEQKREMPIGEFAPDQLSGRDMLVDVRTQAEFEAGHLQGAVNIDWMAWDFVRKWDTIDRDRKVYVYCQAGVRSAKAAHVLDSLGFRVIDLTGGYGEYLQEERP